MDGTGRWTQSHPPNDHERAQDSAQQAHGLLASYPMASVTPTTHVSRHLGGMTTTAAPPSFLQPEYYSSSSSQYQGNPPPYSEYAQELAYVSTTQMAADDSGYWENTRDDAVKYIREQAGPSYQYPTSQAWNNTPGSVQQFSHPSNAFAQSVVQRTIPTSAYPTPPSLPVSASSSSLAFALGPLPSVPPKQSGSRPHLPTQHATAHTSKPTTVPDSHTFFNNFLGAKKQEMAAMKPPVPLLVPSAHPNGNYKPQKPRHSKPQPPPPQATSLPQPPSTPPRQIIRHSNIPPESPDPLSLNLSSSPRRTTSMSSLTSAGAVTPQKRKPVVELVSPPRKRLESHRSMEEILKSGGLSSKSFPSPTSTHFSTPRSHATTVPPTPTSSFSLTSSNGSPLKRERTLTMSHVEVPLKPWLTPKKNIFASTIDSPDLGGYGSVSSSPTRGGMVLNTPGSRRTGDEILPFEKLVTLLEDIMEADDSLPAEIQVSELPTDFFSFLSVDGHEPHLQPGIVRKLTKYIGQVARPSKRHARITTNPNATPGSPRKGRMSDVDNTMLGRVLKILGRGVRAGSELDPLGSVGFTSKGKEKEKDGAPKSPKKRKTPKKKVNSAEGGSPDEGDQDSVELMDVDGNEETEAEKRELTEDDLEKFGTGLEIVKESVLNAECAIALLGSDRLPKQLYSEELINACFTTTKNALTKLIYPFAEASSTSNPLLQHLLKSTTSQSNTHRRLLGELFLALSAVLPKINSLLNVESVSMSEALIIQAVYISIDPFFVVESFGEEGASKGGSATPSKRKEKEREGVVSKTLGKSAMRGLRLDALALIRSIFANHDDQRSWIIEEILSSLIKLSDTKQKAGQFRLRDGKSIKTVSALLLQLVQTSAHDVRLGAKKIAKDRQRKFALKRQESMSESQPSPPTPFLDENDLEETRMYNSGLDSATKAAKTIILFLNQRSGKGKATKNTNEAEYRLIFDNLISDVLAVLYWPEWPAASLVLTIACKYMLASLDDVNSSSQNDNNAAKTIALEHLGVIAARIRITSLKMAEGARPLKPLDEIVSTLDIKELDRFLSTQVDIATHLAKRSSDDQAYDSAQDLTGATLGQELAQALKRVNGWIEDPEDDDLNVKDTSRLRPFGEKLKTILRELWKDRITDVFDAGNEEEVRRVDRQAEEVGSIQNLRNSFQPILSKILLALDAPPIFVRTKALRALGQIVTSDATILSTANVRRSIEGHLLDSSPQVRDAAVELIGKYMVDRPEVAGDYYLRIADRIADTGLSVRKRVIKLLKSYYVVLNDTNRQVDIATRLVLRMVDEDDTVKDLAIKTIEDLWFSTSTLTSTKPKNGKDKGPLLAKVAVIMGTSGNFKDRQSPLEDILHKIIHDKNEHDAALLHSHYSEVCEILIDGLVDASDLPGFTVINCIRTIYLLTSAYPPVLTGANASTLLPYLKSATTPEEQATSDYLLKIFRASVPHMPKTAVKFGQELQTALQPMVIKPSIAGGVQALQESVACICTVVHHLTHDFTRLISLLTSCNGRLQQAIKNPSTSMNPNESRTLAILTFIVSLLAEHCNFDQLRANPVMDVKNVNAINAISSGPITEHIYTSMLRLHDKYNNAGLQARILQCLGFLFRAQPTLMTLETSAGLMDKIFAAPEEDGRARLLKILQDFLISEAEKHAAKEKETMSVKKQPKTPSNVNMDELIGNTDGFADSGVSSAIVQRYLTQILEAALSQNQVIQSSAVDILTFTIKQGLAHPLQSFPVVVALETSPSPGLSNRAIALHTILHTKHTSLLNTRYIVSARTAFDYQSKICQGPVKGFVLQPNPVALLQRWYSLVREKRPTRQEFLKSLVKVYQDKPFIEYTQDDVDFTRFMTENFAAFEYKTQEEVFTIIKYLTSVLSTVGMELLQIISPSHLLASLHDSPPDESSMAIDAEGPNLDDDAAFKERQALMRSSVIIAMVMLLKAYLKTLYGLSEDKCQKFVIGKKSAIGDKATIKRHENPLSWDRMEYATRPILTSEDILAQKKQFLIIWNEDGVSGEPEDDPTA